MRSKNDNIVLIFLMNNFAFNIYRENSPFLVLLSYILNRVKIYILYYEYYAKYNCLIRIFRLIYSKDIIGFHRINELDYVL